MSTSRNSDCDTPVVASSIKEIDLRASSGDNVGRRSLAHKWAQEDRLTRNMWMRRVVILYGCILFFLFAVISIVKPSHVAKNWPSYRSVEFAASPGLRVSAMPTADEGTVKAVGER
jgi:hypothetical protein